MKSIIYLMVYKKPQSLKITRNKKKKKLRSDGFPYTPELFFRLLIEVKRSF
jgi:hypothetical protein